MFTFVCVLEYLVTRVPQLRKKGTQSKQYFLAFCSRCFLKSPTIHQSELKKIYGLWKQDKEDEYHGPVTAKVGETLFISRFFKILQILNFFVLMTSLNKVSSELF